MNLFQVDIFSKEHFFSKPGIGRASYNMKGLKYKATPILGGIILGKSHLFYWYFQSEFCMLCIYNISQS